MTEGGGKGDKFVEISSSTVSPLPFVVNTYDHWIQPKVLPQPALPELVDLTLASSRNPELDRVLLRTYVNDTASSLSDQKETRLAWSEAVPRIALSHPFLADGMLAMGALHLSRLQRNSSAETYLRRATVKFDQCLPVFRNTIETLSVSNCNPLFVFASFIVVFLFAIASNDSGAHLASLDSSRRQGEFRVGAAILNRYLQAFQALRGPLFILSSYFDHLHGGPCSHIFSRPLWPKEPLSAALAHAGMGASADDARLLSLKTLWADETVEVQATLNRTLEDLRWSFALVACISRDPTGAVSGLSFRTEEEIAEDRDEAPAVLTDRSAVLVFPTRMIMPFIELVAAHHRPASILLAYYTVLLDRVGDLWWSKNTGKHIALAVALVLGRESRDWLEWPMAHLGLDEVWADEKENYGSNLRSLLQVDKGGNAHL
ncbi:MAG: hypothetical protein Q9157_005094 [Trypethelium eluteriae]